MLYFLRYFVYQFLAIDNQHVLLPIILDLQASGAGAKIAGQLRLLRSSLLRPSKVCNLLMSSDLSIRFFMLGRSFKSVSNLVFSLSMSHQGTKRRRNIFPMYSKYRPLLPQIACNQTQQERVRPYRRDSFEQFGCF